MSEKKKAGDPGKLVTWQNRLDQSDVYWGGEVKRMDQRELLYNGDSSVRPLIPGDKTKKTEHKRNIVFENIETQVSSSIPKPKVTPRRKEDEHLAEIIEHFLRNELDRLPFETMNDMAERTVPIQGGVGFLTEWNNTKRTHNTVGEVEVRVIHPKQFAPQPGVYTGIEDMDWFIIKAPTTKEAVRRKYGVDVHNESESEPEVRSADGEDVAEDALTQYIGFARNERGGIDRYSWVNDVELEDLENYQARRVPVCAKCGSVRPLRGQIIADRTQQERDPMAELAAQLAAERMAQAGMEGGSALEALAIDHAAPEPEKYDGGPCPYCGHKHFASREQEYEEIMVEMTTAGGVHIDGPRLGLNEEGEPALIPVKVPFYVPDVYPIVLQRSVSVYGQLLGNSDVDQIADQQNTINRMEQKIIDRLLKAGTRVTLPARTDMRMGSEDGDVWHLKDPKEKALIDVFEFKGELQYELSYLAMVYEEARQILGITDSFQGRHDATATSGKAKEFAAAQSAGRLESKRIMKNAAYASIFEMMFKFWLAYGDEKRPVSYKDFKGETQYQEFDRYDFLEKDEEGNWYWNDQFLFSCDSSAPLAANREAMWQETRQNLQSGAFGDPNAAETLILFWAKMEELHYPGAGTTRKYLEQRLERERQQILPPQSAPLTAPPQGGSQMASTATAV